VLSLRADRFYNAPDTEIDVTEQGGLRWGEYAVGRLAAGPEAMSPQVHPFVDEDVAPEVAEKIRRRLGHWIDRRIAALFQPLIALRDDEALTGMARGIAYRLVEALGVLPRAEIADDVKGLDQESRASLRKHGVRFGQYTVFMPLMLKPAPTRLRLVLWALKEGMDTFPEAPPPGLVTTPAIPDAPAGYYPRAGYRRAGDRAIRIDMLERLADMIRPLDARAGFEATADMLSITGLTLEQFARLMQGLGFDFQSGTRPKVKAVRPAAVPEPTADPIAEPASEPSPAAEAEAAPDPDATQADPVAALASEPEPEIAPEPVPEPEAIAPENEAEATPAFAAPDPAAATEAAPEASPGTTTDAGVPAELEAFYIFMRTPRRRPERPQREARKDQPREPRKEGAAGSRKGKPERRGGEGQRTKGRGPKPDVAPREPQVSTARPAKPEKPIDPDNPFAALLALKTRI
jgi:ATP-dependent RNA helicase SUPV3L1/SUV3